MTDFSDFDRYCDEHNITDAEAPIAFAAWLHKITGGEWDGDVSEVPKSEGVVGGNFLWLLGRMFDD